MAALGQAAGGRGGGSFLRWAVLLSIGGWLLLPLVSMLDFSTRGPGGGRTLAAWAQIGTDPDLVAAITIQIELCVVTVILMLVLLVPTMVWVQLRLPALHRTVEFACLLPLTIPAIVIVAGLAPVYDLVAYVFGESVLTLAFIYVILTLPYAYRAIAGGLSAIDLATLADAARSLGCSWPGLIWRVVVPNIQGALIAAALISVALVLGEFTIASLLSYDTLQVVINLLGKRNAGLAVAVSLAALLLAFGLLVLLSYVGGYGQHARAVAEDGA